MSRTRKWLWCIAGLLAATLILLVMIIVTTSGTEVQWAIVWRPTKWRVQAGQRERIIANGEVTRFGILAKDERGLLRTKRSQFGPLVYERYRFEKRVIVGTNEVRVGDVLYDPATMREIWRILAVEKQHEFQDETVQPGVLVRDMHGTEAWMPREKLGKVLVGR